MATSKIGNPQKPSSAELAGYGNPAIESKCRELTACIVQIGGIDELQTALHKHMPDQVRLALPPDIAMQDSAESTV